MQSTRKRTPILLVDDHPMVRERLAELINREADLVVCAEAEDRHQAIETIKAQLPSLVIVDITLKNSDGIELIKDIHSRWPGLLVLVVSMHDESLYAERVVRAGARGYITKQQATRNILQAIRQVLSGKYFLNENISSRLIGRSVRPKGAEDDSPVGLLAERELQVLELTGRGLNIQQIAEEMNVGDKTIETYRHRIREKLQLQNSTDLLKYAITWTHRPQK